MGETKLFQTRKRYKNWLVQKHALKQLTNYLITLNVKCLYNVLFYYTVRLVLFVLWSVWLIRPTRDYNYNSSVYYTNVSLKMP